MRLDIVLVVALLLAPAALARTTPQDQVYFTLAGPSLVSAGANGAYGGTLEADPARSRGVRGVENGIVGLGNQRVDLLLDGVLVASATTASVLGAERWSGRFSASIPVPAGEHTLVAVAWRGTPAEVRSPTLTVIGVGPPSPPQNLTGGPGLVMGDALLEWNAPANDAGGVDTYRVWRAPDASGPWTLRGETPLLAFTDRGEPDVVYAYRVTAANPSGESPPSDVAHVRTRAAPPADLIEVDVVRYRVCNGFPDANCQDVAVDGTAYAYTPDLYVHALVRGRITNGGEPVAGAIASGVVTLHTPRYCPPDEFCITVYDAHEFAFEAATDASGEFEAWVGAARHERFDTACHDVYGTADAAYGSLTDEGDSSFRYCGE